jgi:hypothetical protein
MKVLANAPHQLHLFLGGKTGDDRFDNTTEGNLVHCNETVVIHVGEEAHDELTVHAISNTSMTGNGVSEVLDLKCTFQTRGEESAEWSDQGGEGGKDEDMELHRGNFVAGCKREPDWEVIGMWEENWVRCALQAGEDVCTKILSCCEPVCLNPRRQKLTVTGQMK